MTSKLFIGNLSYKVSDVELSQLFAAENIPVENIKMVRDMETGRSRGFAFAELTPEADMAAAIQKLNGKVLDGRALAVSEARPQKKREFGGGGGFGQGRGRPNSDRPDRGGRGGDRPRRRSQDLY
jgi:RNA recognition motif-containing protein